MDTNHTPSPTDSRADYKRQWQQNDRFRKWLAREAGICLMRLTQTDVATLYDFYLSLPTLKGRTQTATLRRLLRRAELLTTEADYTLTQAIHLSLNIEHLLTDLRKGEVRLTYVLQRGGQQLTSRATLTGPVASLVRQRSAPQASLMQVSFYDLDQQQWRSMHVGDYVGRE